MASDVLKKASFQRNDSQRVAANLEQIYAVWLDTLRQLDAMPVSMYWAAKDSVDCLHVKSSPSNNGTSIGVRIAQAQGQGKCRGWIHQRYARPQGNCGKPAGFA